MTQAEATPSTVGTKARVPFSFGRVWTIAKNTFVEATRQKVFLIVLVVGLFLLLISQLFTQFTFEDRIKFLKDFGFGVITIGGSVISVILTASLLSKEIEDRTIYTILSKPVWRLEFLLGKFIGMLVLLLISIGIMAVVFTGVLFYMEQLLIKDAAVQAGVAADQTGLATIQQVTMQIKAQIRDPNLIKAIILVYFKLVLVTALTLFVSTFSTSMIFTVFISACIYLMGHLQASAREMWSTQGTPLAKFGMLLVAFFIPDLQSFNLVDDIVVGNVITWVHTWKVLGYGIWMTSIITALAYAIFYYKEI